MCRIGAALLCSAASLLLTTRPAVKRLPSLLLKTLGRKASRTLRANALSCSRNGTLPARAGPPVRIRHVAPRATLATHASITRVAVKLGARCQLTGGWARSSPHSASARNARASSRQPCSVMQNETSNPSGVPNVMMRRESVAASRRHCASVNT